MVFFGQQFQKIHRTGVITIILSHFYHRHAAQVLIKHSLGVFTFPGQTENGQYLVAMPLCHFAESLNRISFTISNTAIFRIIISKIPDYHRTTCADVIQAIVCQNGKVLTGTEIQETIPFATDSAIGVKRLQEQPTALPASIYIVRLEHIVHRVTLRLLGGRACVDAIQFRQKCFAEQISIDLSGNFLPGAIVNDVLTEFNASSMKTDGSVDAEFLQDLAGIFNKALMAGPRQHLLDIANGDFGKSHILQRTSNIIQKHLSNMLHIFCLIYDHTGS